jgi:hypothetical protein
MLYNSRKWTKNIIYIIIIYTRSGYEVFCNLVEKNKMAAQTEFPTFCERENGKLFAFYSFYRIKSTIKKLPQIVYRLENEFLKFKMVKNIYF